MIPIVQNSSEFGDATAIIDNSGTYTYNHLRQQALIIAHALEGRKIAAQPVLYLFPSGFQYVAVQWGIWLSGNMAVPVHTAHTPHEIDYFIEDSGATLLICDKTLKHLTTHLKNNIVQADFEELIQESHHNKRIPRVKPESNALMIYTSGTTGKPKGVVISHEQLDTQIRSLSKAWEWKSSDRILNVLPMHHVHGVVNITCCALYNGATVEMQPQFDAACVAKRMASGQLTLFMAVPTIYHKLIQHFEKLNNEERHQWQHGMKTMRLMVSGSAALPMPTLARWKVVSGHTLLERYGMTEIGMALSNPLHGERRAGTVGFPLPFVEVKIADESGNEIKDAGTPGELYVKGKTVFKQYWNKPEETANAFVDGWFKTGDVAEKSSDGYFKILGRKSSDIIKSGGYKISALEIENVLLSHERISECAVIALPDVVWGETIAAAIVGNVLQSELTEWLRDKMAGYKQPRHFVFVKQLPRNAMGKILKPEVRNLFK
ncbi:MAG: acyl-CoA synthetase [Bacteroidia bacterium]